MRGVTVIIAILVMITNLFPIPGTENLSLLLSPGVSFRPYLGQEIPVKSIIKTAREINPCLLYTSPSPRDLSTSRMPSSA